MAPASQPLSPQASLSAILANSRFMSYQNFSFPLSPPLLCPSVVVETGVLILLLAGSS
jgi:hypothetical protein